MKKKMADASQNSEASRGAPPEDGRIAAIQRNAAGQLVIRLEGRDDPVVDAKIARCFPWSMPDGYICIRDGDGKELALLKTLEQLPSEMRRIVETELCDKVFNPQIRRVTECKHEFGVTSITAETDRGAVTFQTRGRDDVRILSTTRALFRDVDGNTYELADLSELDRTSRRHFSKYF